MVSVRASLCSVLRREPRWSHSLRSVSRRNERASTNPHGWVSYTSHGLDSYRSGSTGITDRHYKLEDGMSSKEFVRNRIVGAFAANKLDSNIVEDIAFHMTDWKEDLD